MSVSLRSGVPGSVLLPLLIITVKWSMFIEAKLSVCSKPHEGNHTLYRKASGNDGVVICLKNNGQYVWKFLDGSSTLGEKFNPAKDCSDVVDNTPEAKDGFYWIKPDNGKLSKAWCDLHTDGGGFMLIGMKVSPVTWNVPSNHKPVNPLGPPHWSCEFGDVMIQDFAIQISTTKNFKDTKAYWSYRLKANRALGNLFGVGSGGCTDVHSGIGNVSYVKDILTETVVTTKFNCSKFGPHVDINLGWGRMNSCFRKKCPKGYAFIKGFPFRLDSHGSFSYSASSSLSGITHDATAFVGCDDSKCCACFGPKGGRGHYCRKKCKAINGGTILKGQVFVWFWIRTRMPQRLWKRCMPFKLKTKSGKFETYFIDRKTGIAQKGSCSQQFQTFLNEGTLTVNNKESFDKLPSVPGLLSYRKDNKKLYVNKGNTWDAIGSEEETENVTAQIKHLKVNLQNKISQQDARVQTMKTNLQNKNSQQDGRSQTLETKIQSLKNTLESRIKKIEERLKTKTHYGSVVNPGKSCKDILVSNKFAVSGIYWIKPTSTKLFKVYCDMKTHGGGWTLVYSYTFTNYNSFKSSNNAVTPRPNWPASSANVPISTTPPLSESSLGAVDYSLWKEIGQDIMIKSNINHWIVCRPNGGSMVTKTNGGMSCQNIKNVATACHGVVPNRVYWGRYGPYLAASSLYYYFDGNTGNNWPTHDPCGRNQANHRKGVSNPGGQIYLR